METFEWFVLVQRMGNTGRLYVRQAGAGGKLVSLTTEQLEGMRLIVSDALAEEE